MGLTPISIDELRDRLDILDIIGQHVRLQKAGTEWRGLCPFHDEKTPSFYVNAEKGLWVCRGACGMGGTVFDFVMKVERQEFGEAAEALANRLGCTLRTDQRQVRQADERDRILTVCRLAATVFERALWHEERGRVGREYLAGRGLSDAVVKGFRLGYAPPEWDALTKWFQRKEIPLRDAEAAGLIKHRERGEGYYDRFRGRIMFPILDPQGRTVGFGGRVIDPHDEPKYLNSPESPVFSKRRLLYGLPLAVEAMGEQAVVVEGYMDVIALHEHGVTNAVATLGTALTPQHLRLLRRYTPRVVLCYDADNAGSRASDRAAAMFVESGLDGRVLCLPPGEDPDDHVRRHGPDGLRAMMAAAPDVIDYRLQTALESAGPAQDERSAMVRETVVAILGDISDEVRQAQYVRRIAEWWSGEAVGLQEEFERTLTRALRRRHGGQAAHREEAGRGGPVRRPSRILQVERQMVQWALHRPDRRAHLAESVRPEQFTDSVCRNVYAAAVAATGSQAVADIVATLGPDERGLAADLATREPDRVDETRLLSEWRCLALEAEAATLRREWQAVPEDDVEAQLEIVAKIRNIEQELQVVRADLLHTRGGGTR